MADYELPSYAPVYPITKNVRPRLRQTRLPSSWGIEQVKTVGQNQIAPEWNVKWVLYDEDANILDSFLQARANNNEPFLWAPPGYPQAKYTCNSWTKSMVDLTVSDVQATFQRIFDYNNLISDDFDNAHYAFDGFNALLKKDKYIFGETGGFELSKSLLDDYEGNIDSFGLIDTGYPLSISFSRTYIIYYDPYVYVLSGGDATFSIGIGSDYFGSFDAQIYGWDRDFQPDWWAD